MLTGQAPNGRRRRVRPTPVCAAWKEAAGSRQSFRAEVYEWQIAALPATAKLDEAAKRRVAASLLGATVPLDTRRIGRLEQELRTLALDNAFGRVGDDEYLRRKAALTSDLEEARRPAAGSGVVDPVRAIAWIEDLRSLWEVELPERAERAATRREYEVRRAEANGGRVRAPRGPRARHLRSEGCRGSPRRAGAHRGDRPRTRAPDSVVPCIEPIADGHIGNIREVERQSLESRAVSVGTTMSCIRSLCKRTSARVDKQAVRSAARWESRW
jgi:hypothetical protein